MKKKRIIKKTSALFFSLLLIFSSFPASLPRVEAKKDIDIEDTVPMFANRVENPELKYSGQDSDTLTIDDWEITASDNVMDDGETKNLKMDGKAPSSNWRGLTSKFNHYELIHRNDGVDDVFRGKARAVKSNDKTHDGKHMYDEGWAFYSLSQTVDLDSGADYIFRMDYDTDSAANFLVRIYPGEESSGNGYLKTEEKYEMVKTVEKGDGVHHLKIDLSAAENDSGKATVAIRHIPRKGEDDNAGEFHIYRVGFFLKADYELQEKVGALFTDSNQNELPYNGETYTEAINNIQGLIDEIDNNLNDGTNYHEDVKKHVGESLKKAKDKLKQITDAKKAIDDAYAMGPVDQAKEDELKKPVIRLFSEAFKADLYALIDLNRLKQEVLKDIDEKDVTDDELTEEEQQEEQSQFNEAIEKARTEIKNATTESEVLTSIKELSLLHIEILATLTNKKIANLKHISQSEHDSAKQDVKNELDKQSGLINQAEDEYYAQLPVTRAEFNLEFIIYKKFVESNNQIKKEKEQLKSNLQEEAQHAKDVVDGVEGLTEKGKDSKKAAIDQALNEGVDNIEEAAGTPHAERAKQEGSLAIEKIKGTAGIDAEENLALDNLSGLNIGDRAEKIEQAIKDAANKARRDIDSLTKIGSVVIEVTKGIENINKVLRDAQFEDVKNNAKENIDNKAQAAIDHINEKEHLNDDEKTALIKSVGDARDTALSGIDNANAESGVDKAVKNAESAFDLVKEKADAIDRLRKEAIEAKETVEGFTGLSEDEQATTNDAIDEHLANAIEDIQKAESTSDVTKVEEEASLAIYRKQEKAEIDGHKNEALKEFDKLKNLGDDEEDLRNAIEQADTDAKAAMDERTSKNGITSELNKGMTNIDKALENAQLQEAKNIAKAEIAERVKNAKETIEKQGLLTEDELADAKAAVDQAETDANTAINEAETNKQINNAVDAGIVAIDVAEKKAIAKEDLREKDVSTEDSIDKFQGIDQETKDAAKSQVSAALEKALKAVDDASNTDETDTAVDEGKAAMKKILDDLRTESNDNIEHARANAKEELVAEAEKAKTAVDKLGLSDQEKQAAKSEIDQRMNNALEQVKEAGDFLAIEKEKDKGLVNIEQEKSLAEIKDLQALTEEEKNVATNNVVASANEAKDAIERTETREDANAEAKQGISNIELVVDKAEATDAINKAEKDARAEIETLQDLTDDEKEAKKQAVNGATSSAKEKIDKATNKSEVTTALNDGKTAIKTVVDGAKLQDFKNKAIADIENKESIAKRELAELEDITGAEKQVALDAIHQAVTEANQAIDSADEKPTVTEEKNAAYTAIDKAFNKANAQDDIRHHATNTNGYIDDLQGVNDEEKENAQSEINQIRDNAIASLENNETEADMDAVVEQAKKDMDEIYDAIVTKSDENIENAKDNAKGDLSTEAQKAIDEINDLAKLSDEDKEEAVSKIKTAQTEGEKKIDEASSPSEATTIKDETVVIFDNIVTVATLADAKIQAREDLQEKADATKTAIEALTEIAASEKETAKTAIDDALQEALGNVESAKSLSNVERAIKDGKNAMDDIYDALLNENNDAVEDSKDKQKADLQAEAEKYKKEIDALTHLGKGVKDAAKAEIDNIAKEAEAAIDEATSSKVMTDIKAEAVVDMKDEVTKATLTDAKLDADKQLNTHAETVKENVDALTGVSEEEKESAKTAIDNALSEAKDKVNSSDTVEKVKDATSAGKSAIDAIYNNIEEENKDNIADAKQKAKEELDRVATDAKKEIDDLSHLSDEEKTTVKNAIDQAVEDGKLTIDNADNPKAITSAKEETLDRIKAEKDVAKLADAKARANESLQNKADSLDESINALTGVGDDEKDAAKAEIKVALEDAQIKVNNASAIPAVESAETAGKDAMQDIFDAIAKEDEENINLAKDDAKQELTDAAIEAKDAIDKLSNASDEQKDSAKVAIDDALNAGNSAVDEADSPESITTAKKDALNKMKEAQNKAELQDAQAKSKAEIQTHAKNTKAVIDALTGVSDDAKAIAKQAIEDEVAKTETAIDDATNIDTVEQAEKTGKSAIDSIYDNIKVKNEDNIQNAKDAATEQLDDEAENAKKNIDDLENLSDSEKDALRKEIDDALESGKEAIKNAENPEDITKAKDETLGNIDKVVEKANLQNAKNKAEQELQDKATSTKEAINKLSGVDQDAKDAAIAAVEKALQDALENVESAENIDTVDKAATDGKAEMDRIYDSIVMDNNEILDNAKDKAIEELEKEAEDAKDGIDQLPNLSDEEKEATKDKIDEEVQKGKEAIEKDESPADITESKRDSMDAIDKVVDNAKLADEKIAAKNELVQKSQSTKDAINELIGISEADKQVAKDLIDQALADAKNSVDQAQDSKEVQEAVRQGKEMMDEIYNKIVIDNNENLNNAKDRATKELEKDAEKAKNNIDQLENLTDEEKQAAKGAIDEALEIGKETIKNAESPNSITNAKKDAKDQIDEIVDGATLTDAKLDADKQIQAYAETVKEAVDALSGVSEDEKESAKTDIDNALNQAVENINHANTITAVEDAMSNGKAEIDAIYDNIDMENEENIQNARDAATEQLDDKATNAKEKIDNLENLSDDEKDAFKNEIDDVVKTGKKAIEKAENPDDMIDVTKETIESIDNIVDGAILADEKITAKNELKQKALSTKAAIDKLTGVNKAEKDTAKSAIDQALVDGEVVVDQAQDVEEVWDAVSLGKAAIDQIYNAIITENYENLDQAKDRATNELEEESKIAKDQIDQLENLTDEEKQTAKAAIDEALKAGKTAIEKAKDPYEITEEKNAAKNKMYEIVENARLKDQKISANKEVEESAKEIKDKIDQLQDRTEKEKEGLKSQIDEILDRTTDNINKSVDLNAIEAALNKGISEMEDRYKEALEVTIDEDSQEDNTLPKTATNIYNELLLGIGFLVMALLILLYSRRRVVGKR